MTPTFQSNSASLYLGDCLEVMPCLDAGSIDMVLCDLPYGTTQSPWDAVIPFEPLWAQLNRLCKGAVVLFAGQPFTSALVMSNPRAFRHEWIWEKNKASGHLNAKRRPMLAHESVLVFGNASLYQPQMTEGHKPGNKATRSVDSGVYGKQRKATYGGSTLRYPRSVQRFDIVNNDDPDKSHPNQKPTDWLEYLLRTYSLPEATILDATMGSGSTGVACMKAGRRFVGIERDPAFFATAERRIRTALAPPDHGPLFAAQGTAA